MTFGFRARPWFDETRSQACSIYIIHTYTYEYGVVILHSHFPKNAGCQLSAGVSSPHYRIFPCNRNGYLTFLDFNNILYSNFSAACVPTDLSDAWTLTLSVPYIHGGVPQQEPGLLLGVNHHHQSLRRAHVHYVSCHMIVGQNWVPK